MSRISAKNLFPSSGTLQGIYRGVVEDNKDPDKRGRCRIRVYGLHTPVKTVSETEGIPTSALPWAEPALSLFEGSISGFGLFSVPVQGSHIYLFFESGNINQPRYFASAPGVPKNKANVKDGFNDPSGIFPLSTLLGEPDWNRLARDVTDNTAIKVRDDNRIEDIPNGNSGTWSEPRPYYFLGSNRYPNNSVLATHGGFVIELDSTPDQERFHLYHPSNSYIEISSEGEMIIRNEAARYNLIIGNSYEYIDGSSYRFIEEDENEIISGEKKISVKSDETKVVQGNQTSYGVQGQTLASGSSQNISAKGSQNVGVWGSQTFSGKGTTSHSTLGFFSSLVAGFKNTSTYGPAAKNSMAPNQTGGTPTLLGKKPISEALNKTNTALSGIEAAIHKAMSPIVEGVQKFQEAIGEGIQNAVSWANGVLKPITDVVVQIDSIATYVKNEMNAAKQLYETVTNAPQRLITTISNYASTIMNFPGQVGQNIINQVSGIPADLNLVKSLLSVYSSANEIYTTSTSFEAAYTPTIKLRLDDFNTLNQAAFDYSSFTALGDIYLYPRSGAFGIGSFKEGGEAYLGLGSQDINDQYFYTVPASTSVSMSSISGSGGLVEEFNEMSYFVTETLSAAFVDGAGDFQIDDAIDYIYTQVGSNFKTTLWANATLDDFELGIYLIDPIILEYVGGLVTTPVCSGDGYLTDEQQQHTAPFLLNQPLMDQALRSILWDYPSSSMYAVYDAAIITEEQYRSFQDDLGGLATILEENPGVTIKALYDATIITEEEYQSFRLPGETDEEYNTRMESYSTEDALLYLETEADSEYDAEMQDTIVLEILNAYVTTEIKNYINTIYDELDDYIVELIIRIKISVKELFAKLIQYEMEVREIAQYLTVENADWAGKYDDFPEIEEIT